MNIATTFPNSGLLRAGRQPQLDPRVWRISCTTGICVLIGSLLLLFVALPDGATGRFTKSVIGAAAQEIRMVPAHIKLALSAMHHYG